MASIDYCLFKSLEIPGDKILGSAFADLASTANMPFLFLLGSLHFIYINASGQVKLFYATLSDFHGHYG